MKFKGITVALDMYGCPNRCRHCWIGHSPNGNLSASDLQFAAEQFRPFTDCLTVYDWYREPDYKDNYRELWNLCGQLSDTPREHFELISVWRMVRDKDYVGWLSSLGLNTAQLTLFGDSEKTDYYTGRKNAYNEILHAAEILIENKISPRLQIFINKDNLSDMPFIEKLIQDLELESRCRSFGGEFSCFLHQGSCDGENEKLYDIRVTPEDLDKLPQSLVNYTLKYLHKKNISEVFGRTECSLYSELIQDTSTAGYVSDTPVFYIDKDFNVYPNITAPSPYWLLGNLKADGAETVLENYIANNSPAQHIRATIPLCRMVRAVGTRESQRLFSHGDYITYLLNQYCKSSFSELKRYR